ncbi:AAA family ATPase [Bradyrhizobium sp. 482_C4_N1_1]|uniref:AAA family ATPase n=1 Tax=unclassified Bradyrhizobium TaxID=2631580 RepID=UPI003F8C59A9
MTIRLVHPEVQALDHDGDEPARPNVNVIEPSSVFGDPALLPCRKFIYGKHYLRGAVSMTVADGGVGKSTLAIAEGVAMALGRNLLGETVPAPLEVLYINLEEPKDEILRRVFAVCQHHRIDPKELKGRLFYQSGLDHPIIAASMERGRIVLGDLPASVRASGFYDVLIIDPLVGAHGVAENDNSAINAVMKQFAQIAAAEDMAVEIVHHIRKPVQGGQPEAGVSDTRGASAAVNAARSVRVLNPMSEAEAHQGRVGDRRAYFHATGGKANYGPLGGADWYRLVPVDLSNGDNVATVEAWTMPGLFEGVTTADMMRVRLMAAKGEYRSDPQSGDWIGKIVADVLGLDIEADKKRIKAIVKTWMSNGVLAVERRKDATRRERSYVVPGEMDD